MSTTSPSGSALHAARGDASQRFRRAYISGASQGLGRALALALAAPGVRLVLQARGAAALAQVAALAEARGAAVTAIAADAGDPAPGAPAALAARVLEALGTPDLVVLNASTLGPVPLRPLLDVDDDALRRVFEVNLLGPARLARRLLPAMLLAGRGTLVTISSDAAVEHYPTWGAYGASKAALDHLAATWAAEAEGGGVRILAVDPGEMDTAMHAAALPDADPASLQRPDDVAAALLAELGSPTSTATRLSLPTLRGAA